MKRILLATLLLCCADALADWKCLNPEGLERVYAEPFDDGNCKFIEPKPVAPKQKPFKSNPKEAKKAMEKGKRAILAELKDPDSAKFRGLFVQNDFVLCGEVNAKNSYGGYTGFKRFIALGATNLTWYDDDSEKFILLWASSCLGLTEDEISAVRSRINN